MHLRGLGLCPSWAKTYPLRAEFTRYVPAQVSYMFYLFYFRILTRYVSKAYRIRIRIRYVSIAYRRVWRRIDVLYVFRVIETSMRSIK
jgi:hypothetical protein